MSAAGPDPDWARVNDLFHRALEQPSAEQEAFLEAACAGNSSLLSEVSSLLASHKRAGGFIEDPARQAMLSSSLAGVPGVAGERPSALINRTIGQYRILHVIGEGGMGVVYLAEDTRLGRTVALKAIAPRFASHAARRERLRREARAAAALNHPGIATVYALEEIDDRLYIAAEYVPGETLRAELANGPIAVTRAIETVRAAARALAVAHDRGIIHRDLKPENLIRAQDGHVKILDFGLARIHDPGAAVALTDDGSVLGTPAYMSPEQIRGGAVDGRSDVFALGIVLYELVTGVHPFGASDPASTIARILENEPARLVEGRVSGLHPPMRELMRELAQVVSQCLEKRPEARVQSAQALADALDQMLAAQEGAAPVGGIRSAPVGPRRPSRHALWWWQFHQAAATLVYVLLLVPLWRTRALAAGSWGTPLLALFLIALVAVTVAGGLRLHLWFAVQLYPSEWWEQRDRAATWIRSADVAFAATLAAGGLLAISLNDAVGVLLVAAAAGALLSSVIIEPATTRAAFGAPGGRNSSG